jgi:hypothetical protein
MLRSKIVRNGLITGGLTTLAVAGVAAAAGPTVKVSVSPNKAGANSTLKVSANGPFGETGLPTALQLTAQKGFASSAKSVTKLCNSSKVPTSGSTKCPAASKVGSGKAVGKAGPNTETLTFTQYLGTPSHKGDIASVVLSGKNTMIGQLNVVGRLFKAKSGSIEILFSQLPAGGLPLITLQSVSFSAHAVNGKHSLVTNPSSCKGGHWSGTFKLAFPSGTISKKTQLACKK